MSELKIQRWKPEALLMGGEPEFNMLPSRKGDFVLHDVAQVEFYRLTAQVEELKGFVEDIATNWNGELADKANEVLTRIGEDK